MRGWEIEGSGQLEGRTREERNRWQGREREEDGVVEAEAEEGGREAEERLRGIEEEDRWGRGIIAMARERGKEGERHWGCRVDGGRWWHTQGTVSSVQDYHWEVILQASTGTLKLMTSCTCRVMLIPRQYSWGTCCCCLPSIPWLFTTLHHVSRLSRHLHLWKGSLCFSLQEQQNRAFPCSFLQPPPSIHSCEQKDSPK